MTTSPAGRFAATRWTVVITAGHQTSRLASRALEELRQTYWYPLYAYVRRCGYDAYTAEDLTQEFFARLLAKKSLADVDRTKGKFRSFLVASLKHFLANEWDKARAKKRGGDRTIVSLDAETRYQLEPSDGLSADKLLDRQWALALLDLVLARLQAESDPIQFALLKSFLTAGVEAIPYAEVAGKIGMTEGAVKVAVHRLRKRYRTLLREGIAHTVASPAEVDEELRSTDSLPFLNLLKYRAFLKIQIAASHVRPRKIAVFCLQNVCKVCTRSWTVIGALLSPAPYCLSSTRSLAISQIPPRPDLGQTAASLQ